MLRTSVTGGAVTRLIDGVYLRTEAVRSDHIGRHLQLALAHQVLRPRMIASHHTAALAWGLDLDDPAAMAQSPAAFIAPHGEGWRAVRLPDARIAVRRLPTAHRTTHPSELLVTTPARTAVDVASLCSLPEALITLDSAARLALSDAVGSSRVRDAYRDGRRVAASRAPLIAAVEHAATQFTRKHLLGLVPLADPRRESPLESLSYGRMLQAGLPLPELQVCLRTSVGDVYPDNLWPEHKLVGEADGFGKYDDPGSLVAEKVRQQALEEELGYMVVRWTSEQMRLRPGSVINRLASALDARAPR